MALKKPTDKQISYASAIAESLEIELPTTFDIQTYGEFIKTHKDRYNQIFLMNRIYGDERYYFLPERKFGDDFGRVTTEWLIENLYKQKGIYAFIDKDEVLYIGKSKNLAERIPSSYKERSSCGRINRIMYYPTLTDADTNILEIILISENKPILNSESNSQDKSTIFHSNISILEDFNEVPLIMEG